MPAGRPTDYTPELTEAICEHLAGGKSLRAFCANKAMPDVSTVCRWIVKHAEFRKQYMEAREAAGFAHADGIVETVELIREGEIDGNTGRAMMDGLKWAAERMAPKVHSPRQEVDNTSSDGSMATKPTVIQLVAPEAHDDSED